MLHNTNAAFKGVTQMGFLVLREKPENALHNKVLVAAYRYSTISSISLYNCYSSSK